MSELEAKENYFLVFEVDGFNLLLSDLIMQSYGTFGQIELYQQGHLREYSNMSLWIGTSAEGIRLYRSDKVFKGYLNQLEKAFTENELRFKSICSVTVSRLSVQDFFHLAKQLLDLYVKMSPMFTDKAYGQSKDSPTLMRNLARTERAKETYRQLIK
jgi:hypothetical protein